MTFPPGSAGLVLAPAGWRAEVPVELGREEARELAERELAHPSYDAEPPLFQQLVEWLIDRIQDLIGRTAGALDGAVGGAVLLAVVALAVAVVARRMGPLARRGTRSEPIFPTGRRTAAQYRAGADAAAARGDWSTAVIERYRAVVAEFEERGLLDPRPGRTADEAADEAGAMLPALATELTSTSKLFDAVRYGGRTATPADDERLRRLDDDARDARPGPAGPATGPLAPALPQ